ncbi:ATP-binding protein [Lentibacillus cibarius]|uniref:ATP-binding protein n=1 Tax=Lentibacillus cibarius TaxID=2583219 RepID=A0A5S3QGD1_9BACI|nr:ATP-binding protein [Lentibacillus cibarius]
MYKSFYSLAHEPFTKEISSSEAFASSSYQETLARLDYLKKIRGMGLLVGEPGAGKTFALRAFQAFLNRSLYHVVYFPLSTGSVMDFYRGLAYGLGEEPKFRKENLFRQIQNGIERMSDSMELCINNQYYQVVVISDTDAYRNWTIELKVSPSTYGKQRSIKSILIQLIINHMWSLFEEKGPHSNTYHLE